ncbi:hypothetical protein AAG906_040004 [Vitis piasezkii]
MGKFQIEDRRQQQEIGEDPKKEKSPLALPPPQQVQDESSQDLPKDWKFVINHPQYQIIELNFFLGLQIKQLKEETFINQAKYIRDLLKRFKMEEAKTMKTPMSSSIKLDKNEKVKSIYSTMYRDMIDADFSSCRVERKNTSGTCHFLGHLLVSWHRFRFWTTLSSSHAPQSVFFLLSCLPKVSVVSAFLSTHLVYFVSVFLMALRRESAASRAQEKCLAETSQPAQAEARRKVRFDTALFNYVEDYQIYKQKATYDIGGTIIFTVRGVEIQLDLESICRIFYIAPIRLKVYERIHLGYLMMMHMISCCESTTRVLPCDCFLTRVFKDVGVDLSRKKDFEVPNIYDTYVEQSLGRMKFEKRDHQHRPRDKDKCIPE